MFIIDKVKILKKELQNIIDVESPHNNTFRTCLEHVGDCSQAES